MLKRDKPVIVFRNVFVRYWCQDYTGFKKQIEKVVSLLLISEKVCKIGTISFLSVHENSSGKSCGH